MTEALVWTLAIIALLACVVAARLFMLRLRERHGLTRIGVGLQELAEGNLAYRITAPGSNAVTDLANSVNLLAESIQDARIVESRRDEAHKQLISNLSHDLRTPITSIAGYVDALQRGLGDDPSKHIETLAVKAAELTRLADDLFYLTKLDSGDLEIKLVPLDLGEMARRTVLGFERELAARNVEVSVDIPEATCPISADEAALQRVIGNFVANSLKHARGMTHFGISVSSAEGQYTIEVWDDGAGFSKGVSELLERGASVGPGGGSGLGLSIAHDLTQRMGGSIRAQSEPGVRTSVCVTFPPTDAANGASG